MAYHNAYTSAESVILTAAGMAQDEGGKALGYPFYAAALRDAVIELCYDTAWDKRAVTKLIPEDRIIDLPEDMGGAFNIFAFSGEHCNIENSKPVLIKKNYSHQGGSGFLANNKGYGDEDPLYPGPFTGIEPTNLYYGGITMGKLYVCPAVKAAFTKVQIQWVGLGQENECEVPVVPTWAKDAIAYWVARRACQMRLSEGNIYRDLETRWGNQVDAPRAAWAKARMRYRSMDQKQRQDANIYNTFLGYPR